MEVIDLWQDTAKTATVAPPHCMIVWDLHPTKQWKRSWNTFRCKSFPHNNRNRKEDVSKHRQPYHSASVFDTSFLFMYSRGYATLLHRTEKANLRG